MHAWNDLGLRNIIDGKTMIIMGRLIFSVVALAATVVFLIQTWLSPSPLLSGTAPLVLAASALLVVHHGYLAIRALRWRVRRKKETREKAESESQRNALGVARPEAFEGVEELHKAQHELLASPSDHQGAMYARGLKVAVLPALAVLLTALAEVRSNDPSWTTSTVVAEIAVLATVIFLVQTRRSPTGPWLDSRIRAELMRREQYLCLAGVGPYLGLSGSEARAQAAGRIDRIAHGTEPEAAVPMRSSADGGYWVDELWSNPAHSPLPRLLDRAQTYLHNRIGSQISWFQRSRADTANTARAIGMTVQITLFVAIGVGFAQAAMPVFAGRAAGAELPRLLAFALPPVVAVLISVRELYAYRGRSTSYKRMLADLENFRKDLARLISEIESSASGAVPATVRFQAFVLHTEAALTAELQTWIMITDREEFDVEL